MLCLQQAYILTRSCAWASLFLCAHVSDFYFTTRRPTTLIQASVLDIFLINDDYISFHCEAPETEAAADGRKRLCLSMNDAGH